MNEALAITAKVLKRDKAVREASLSIACLLDEPDDISQADLIHLQDQITIIENFLDPFTVAEMEKIKND